MNTIKRSGEGSAPFNRLLQIGSNDKIAVGSVRECCYYCNRCIYESGARVGERNFWLGRLTKQFQKEGKTKRMALADLLEWNKCCEQPESEATLKRNFEAYWKTDYKQLGCVDSIGMVWIDRF